MPSARALCMAGLGIFLPAAAVSAGEAGTTVTPRHVTITVRSAGRTAVVAPDLSPVTGADGTAMLRLTVPLDVAADGVLLGRVSALQIGGSGPSARLSFAVQAGAAATNFTITTALVSFEPYSEIQAYASAGITVTDVDGDGATITGNQAGANVYEARINGSGWQQLLPSTVAGADDTAVADDRAPASGEATLVGTHTSIQSEFAFTLTAQDAASGTSNFTIAPVLVPGAPPFSVEVDETASGGIVPVRIHPRLEAVGDGAWAIGEPVDIVEDGRFLGRVDALRVLMVPGDPSVVVAFTVTAGQSPTQFTIASAPLAFAAIDNPIAHASAGITITDNDADGATLTGLQAGATAMEARYGAGTPWAYLVVSTSAPADDTSVRRDRQPGTGWQVIPATVSSTQVEWAFQVTANDSASGTVRFAVAPAPEAIPFAGRTGLVVVLILISLLGVMALRRGR